MRLCKAQVCDNALFVPGHERHPFDRPRQRRAQRLGQHRATGLADGRQPLRCPFIRTALPQLTHQQAVRQHDEVQVPGLALTVTQLTIPQAQLLDVIGNKESAYNSRMMTYTQLQSNRRKFLAVTGLTVPEFGQLLTAFSRAYQRLYPPGQTVEGQPRQRSAGGGRKGLLHRPEEKLLFILAYLKTYPLQVVIGELFGLSQPQANHWIQRLLPVLQVALDDLGVRPERDPRHFAQSHPTSEPCPRLIIDGTERRRQRPKNPEKQASHYSGRKKTHSDKNVVIAEVESKRIGFLSGTYAGKTADKTIAGGEGNAYPPGTVLYKDAGFQGYEPAVQETRQAKKKATPRGTHGR